MAQRFCARLRAAAKNGRRLGLLLALAAALGALAGVLDAVFGRGILALTELREQWPLLMLLLADAAEENGICPKEKAGEVRRIVNTQNDLLGKIYGRLRMGEGIEKEKFDEISQWEIQLRKLK